MEKEVREAAVVKEGKIMGCSWEFLIFSMIDQQLQGNFTVTSQYQKSEGLMNEQY